MPPPPNTPDPARAAGDAIPGVWTPAPGRIVHLASTDSAVALAEVPESGYPMRVHVGRRESDGALRWERAWEVPWPPTVAPGHDLSGSSAWLDVHAVPAGLAVAFTRVEYQGGSHGIALATLGVDGWADFGELASPTDSDIQFGTPVFRRADTVVTCESEERLWHYERQGSTWKGTPCALPLDGSILTGPPMAMNADGTEFALLFEREAQGSRLAIYRRAGGTFRLAGEVPVPAVNAIVYFGEGLYVGFAYPAPDGSLVWALGRSADGGYEVRERRAFPTPADPKQEHLRGLAVSADWLLVRAPDEVWATRRSEAEAPRRLELPARGGAAAQHFEAVLLGSTAVVLLDEQLGAFALSAQ